jgi:hypothetical protein
MTASPHTKSFDTVLAKFEVASRNGVSAQARCPAHDDHDPSLTLTLEGDKVLIHCHAGCPTANVLQAAGLTPRDLFLTDRRNGTKPTAAKRTEYIYSDEDAQPLYRVVRLDQGSGDKKIWQERFDPATRSYVKGVRGVRLVPYRLRTTLAADEIFIAEGEKCVDALADRGLVATTSPMGAGKWRDEFADYLVGKRIVILPDADGPGRQHAITVGESLVGKAAEVRVLELVPATGATPKGYDVADWLADGHDVTDLRALADAAPTWDAWRGTSDVTEESDDDEGKVKKPPLSQRIRADLTSWGFTFSKNEMDGTIYISDKPLDGAGQARIHMAARDNGYGANNRKSKGPLEAVDDMVAIVADENRFHPVRDYLDGLTWDGTHRLRDFFGYIQTKNPPITYKNGRTYSAHSAFLFRWMVNAVQRVYEGGRVQNFVLVLDGAQGIGKSLLVRWLGMAAGEDYFIEQPVDPDNREHIRWLSSKFVWEIGEFGSTVRKSHHEALKQFITRSTCSFRVPYDKNPIDRPALASFIATINDETGFLTDPTGNRRFVTLELESIDWEYQNRFDVSQLWAEVVHAYRNGETGRLSPEEVAAQEAQNRDHLEVTDEEEAIRKYYQIDPDNQDWWTATVNIAEFMTEMDYRTNTTRIGKALARLVGTKNRERRVVGGKRLMGFAGIIPDALAHIQAKVEKADEPDGGFRG